MRPLPPPGPPAALPPPGWYPDPWRAAALRWWDGRAWTGHVAHHAAAPWASPTVRAPAPTYPIGVAVAAVGILAGLFALDRVIIGPLADARLGVVVTLTLLLLLTYGPFVALAVAVSRRYGTGRLGADLGFTGRAVDLGWGLVCWLAVIAGNIVLRGVLVATGIPFTSNLEADDNGTEPNWAVLVIAAVIVAPAIEELFFRGVLLRALRSRLAPPAAIAVQGIVFGAAHVIPENGTGNIGLVLVLAWAGIAFGALAHWTGRLAAPIVAHLVMNAVALAALYAVS